MKRSAKYYAQDSRASHSNNARDRKANSSEPEISSSNLTVYRKALELGNREIERLYAVYYSKPEDHPAYRQEWNKFYDVRSAQLCLEGINPKAYDYSDEWRSFFLSRLKVLRDEETREFKATLTEKYSNRTSRSREKHRKRSSGSYHRRRRSRSRSRISTSSESSRDLSPRERCSNKQENIRQISVRNIYQRLLQLDREVIMNRAKIRNLLEKAIFHEQKYKRDYLMDKDESTFLHTISIILRNTLMLKRLPKYVYDEVTKVNDILIQFITRWKAFNDMIDDNLYSSISSTSLSPIKDSKNIKKEKIASERKESCSSGYKSGSTDINPKDESDSIFKKLELFGHKFDKEKSVTLIPLDKIKSEPIDSPVKIKEEKNSEIHSKDILELLEEKQDLLKKLLGTEKSREENCLAKTMKNDISITAKSISDDELIGYLKELEKLSEEEQSWLLQVMTDIEENDENRFNRLKCHIYAED